MTMKINKLWFLLAFLFSSPLLAQYEAINGQCSVRAREEPNVDSNTTADPTLKRGVFVLEEPLTLRPHEVT